MSRAYNFDQLIDRHGTSCTKYDGIGGPKSSKYPTVLPLWIADMDFATPCFVADAIRKRLEHPVLGYSVPPQAYAETLSWWLARRYQVETKPEELMYTPGVVAGIYKLVQLFTEKGEGVLVLPPVYTPFSNVITHSERKLVEVPLLLEGERYEINWPLLEQRLPEARAMILCNPHNPGGRVWQKEELLRIAELTSKHGVLVLSDEIHADLTFEGYQHHPFPSISAEARANSIALMAPSKAFNMPGVIASHLYIPNAQLRTKVEAYMVGNGLSHAACYTYDAVIAAYRQGEEWLASCMRYIGDNVAFVRRFIKERIPMLSMIEPEASFLIFLDCRQLGLPTSEALHQFLIEEAGLYLNNGADFGTGGEGFMRLNVGVPRSVLEEAMQRLEKAVNNL